jgi:hypothetical protein
MGLTGLEDLGVDVTTFLFIKTLRSAQQFHIFTLAAMKNFNWIKTIQLNHLLFRISGPHKNRILQQLIERPFLSNGKNIWVVTRVILHRCSPIVSNTTPRYSSAKLQTSLLRLTHVKKFADLPKNATISSTSSYWDNFSPVPFVWQWVCFG